MTPGKGFDVAIVGSGLVGSALACALDGSGLRVALIESEAPRASAPLDDAAALDRRNLALAKRSVDTLSELDVWTHASARATGIREVHVSRRGDFGALRLDAREHRLEAFGATVPASVLGDALESRLRTCKGLTRLQPARLEGYEPEGAGLNLHVMEGKAQTSTLRTRLLVAADGSDSSTRERAGIRVSRRDYGQTAIVGAMTLDRDHEGRAFERFLPNGLVAMLPLAGRSAGFVWVQPASDADASMQLTDDAFVAALQGAFGHRLGAFRRVGRRQRWPLHAVTAHTLVAGRVVVVGNAAQTVHPVGAQGFNLGLRDAVTLAEVVLDAHSRGSDIGDATLLAAYARRREPDRQSTLAASDSLVDWFALSHPALRVARGLALAAAARIPSIRRGLARRGMGYRSEGAE